MNVTRKEQHLAPGRDALEDIRSRLKRLRALAFRQPEAAGAWDTLVACVDELEILIPILSEHMSAVDINEPTEPAWGKSGEPRQERVRAERKSKARELRALLESGRRALNREGSRDPETMAEALVAYLAACVEDLLKVLGSESKDPDTEITNSAT